MPINIFAESPADWIDVAEALGSQGTAMHLNDVAPGRSSSPYHYEYEEEWLLVVSGTLALRGPDGERTLEAGDLVCFPAGPTGAHKLMNRSDTPARTLMFSSSRVPAVSVYPDSDKSAIWPDNDVDAVIVRRSAAVRYDEGEEGWQTAT